MRGSVRARASALVAGAALLACPLWVNAHGGVVAEEDTCLLRMGFLQAHFTLYLPESRGSVAFCENLPEVGSSLFVIEYLHEMMKQMPIDFRIVADHQGFGIFANWDDVQSIPDLEAQTVLHHTLAPEQTGVLALRHQFEEAGGYIGIVVAENLANGKIYNAVFYFEVGSTGYGLLPLFAAIIVAAQLLFWYSTGGLQRFMRRGRHRLPFKAQQ